MYEANDGDRVVRTVAARLPSGAVVRVETAGTGTADSGDGMASVGLKDTLHLDEALDSVGEVAALVWAQVGRAMPSKATVQLKMGFTVESGKLAALWMGGKGDAALTVTMEWSGDRAARDVEGRCPDTETDADGNG